jgi:hypothetical protein
MVIKSQPAKEKCGLTKGYTGSEKLRGIPLRSKPLHFWLPVSPSVRPNKDYRNNLKRIIKL